MVSKVSDIIFLLIFLAIRARHIYYNLGMVCFRCHSFKLIFLKSAVCKVACCTEVRKNEYLCSPIIMGHT